MKYLIVLSLFFSSLGFSQQSNLKSLNVSFLVKGVCEMCKDRIEIGTLKLKGVKYVNWDIISSNISLIYNSKKISLDEIHKGISLYTQSNPIVGGYPFGTDFDTSILYAPIHGALFYIGLRFNN